MGSAAPQRAGELEQNSEFFREIKLKERVTNLVDAIPPLAPDADSPEKMVDALNNSGMSVIGTPDQAAAQIGGFEGNAQSFRLLTRLEASEGFDAPAVSVLLKLERNEERRLYKTRATIRTPIAPPPVRERAARCAWPGTDQRPASTTSSRCAR